MICFSNLRITHTYATQKMEEQYTILWIINSFAQYSLMESLILQQHTGSSAESLFSYHISYVVFRERGYMFQLDIVLINAFKLSVYVLKFA